MSLSKALLPEFDHEMANTRKSLERIPDEKLDWKPHEKSMTMGGLATHLVNLLTWTNISMNEVQVASVTTTVLSEEGAVTSAIGLDVAVLPLNEYIIPAT